MNNDKLRELAVKLGCFMLDKLNEWSLSDVKAAIKRYDAGPPFDKGVAQFLRLYLAARTIGAVTKR